MKNSNYLLMMLGMSLVLSFGACSKKKGTTSNANFNSNPSTNTRVDNTNSIHDDDPVISDPQLSPTCFNYMSNFSLSSLNHFFYPDHNPINPPIPNANGDLTFCMEYHDSPSILGHLRLEYHYTTASQPGVLKVVRFTTKIFKDDEGNILTDNAEINARLYFAAATSTTLEIIFMDSVGFIGLTAGQVSGAQFNGRIHFANMPGDSDVGDGNGSLSAVHLANTADEEKCLNGTWSADTCVSTKVFGKSFYEKGRDGTQTATRSARVVAMVRKLLLNSHPTAFNTFEIKSMMLGDSMDIDLDDAKATILTE